MSSLLAKKQRVSQYGGLYGSSSIYYIKKFLAEFKNIIVLVDNNTEINNLSNEFNVFKNDQTKISKFLDLESLPYEDVITDVDINGERLKTFNNLFKANKNIVFTTYSAIIKRLVPTDVLENYFIEIDKSSKYNNIRKILNEFNYHRCDHVTTKGEYSIRGPIIDIFSATCQNPIRIVFDGENIENIKEFDSISQKSYKEINDFLLSTTSEILLDDDTVKLYKKNCHKYFEKDYIEDIEYDKITNKINHPTIFTLLPLFYNYTSSFFDLFDGNQTAIITTKDISVQLKKISIIYKKYYKKYFDEKYLLDPKKLILERVEYEKLLSKFYTIELSTYKLDNKINSFNLNTKKLPSLIVNNTFNDPYKYFKTFITNTIYKTLICIRRKSLYNEIKNILNSLQLKFIEIDYFDDFIKSKSSISLTKLPVDTGFIDNNDKIAIISDKDIFGSRSLSKPESQTKKNIIDEYINDIASLEIDSPIVHDNYGVGRYKGLMNMDVEGIQTELVKIEYADSDILYIPVTSINLIKKYAGYTGINIPLHRLGTNQWIKIKNRAKKKINDIAVELLEIQSRRYANKGFKFNIDYNEYKQFCEKFPFVETEDQLKAINDVIESMSLENPMDRLICGDVGFGKTEIIMRAGYIASLNDKKTVILAPTTILVEQHYKSFLKRFEDTPIIIKKYSRLQTPAQRKKIFDAFNSNKIDILIGTHAILSNSSKYQNIGLLVIDEEHKFGVIAKEKLKKLKGNVDVITLTATPIPRTLNSALAKIKDLSVIETPPKNRKSISTLITEWDIDVISDAIQREIQRGGQIYFVNDQIKTMDLQIERLHEIDKNLRIGIIHGQLSNKEIETQMNSFLNNKIDLLMCTSIIESGLDIQNVNTIIINNANKFGLSQLHQIRGRVGRTNRQAYAYLIVDSKKLTTKDAAKRLEAFDSVDSLGGGLELATHDLEIRGAGELLGEEQSGQIYEVGYAMFTDMLKKSIDFLKTGHYMDENIDFEIDVNISALIPQEYINDIFTRLTYYKKISTQKNIEELKEIKNELIDRFGLIPDNLENLFIITQLKIQLAKFNLNYLKLSDTFIRIKYRSHKDIDINKIVSKYKGNEKIKILKDGSIQYNQEFNDLMDQCKFIKDFVTNLNQ